MARKTKAKRKRSPRKKPAPSPDRFYRRIGDKGWANSDYFTYSSMSPAFRRWLAAELGEAPRTILSVGCGNGELESFLAGEGHRIVGLDLSFPMLKRVLRAGLVAPVAADAGALPFAAASFEIVIFPESIGHVRLPAVFAETRRVLRKRGTLIVTTYASHVGVHAHYRKYRFAEMNTAAVAVGLSVAAERYLAAKRNSVEDAPSDAKATLLYFKAFVPR